MAGMIEPVGTREIAELLDVPHQTIRVWRVRESVAFPEPAGYVSGVAWWDRKAILKWWEQQPPSRRRRRGVDRREEERQAKREQRSPEGRRRKE